MRKLDNSELYTRIKILQKTLDPYTCYLSKETLDDMYIMKKKYCADYYKKIVNETTHIRLREHFQEFLLFIILLDIKTRFFDTTISMNEIINELKMESYYEILINLEKFKPIFELMVNIAVKETKPCLGQNALNNDAHTDIGISFN